MKIEMTKEQCYTLMLGNVKHVFTVTSEWNGLKELRTMENERLIVSTGNDMFANLFPTLGKETEVIVIGGSPDLLAALRGEGGIESLGSPRL